MSPFEPLTIASDRLRISVLPQGASLVGVHLTGCDHNHVLGFADPRDHLAVPVYAGAIVGPVANRLQDGRVEIEGRAFQMPLNENGQTTLHSGPEGLHANVWEIAAQSASDLVLSTSLADGLCGLPGNRKFTAHYQVMENTLHLTLEASSDQTTPINLAAHPYWSLDGAEDVSGHNLQIHADSYLPTDVANLPLGESASVAGTSFDFSTARKVPLSPDLDVNFCLSSVVGDELRPAVTLTGNTGTTLRITTNAPGVQVYNGAFLPDLPAALSNGAPLGPYSAIALEPQHWPNAPYHAHFPSILLRSGAVFRQITDYQLTPS